MTLNWFTSKTVREANAMCKHVHKLLQHQRDILSAKAISEVEASLGDIRDAIAAKADKATLEKKMEALEKTANQWLKPYPNAAWRENVEVLLVALAVAMGIRTFFLQPFKIPTASMQPTLYGILQDNLLVETNYQRPTGWARVKDWFGGGSYLSYKADQEGTFDGVSKPLRFLIFNIKQTLWYGGKPHNFWFVPDTGGGMPLQLGMGETLRAMFADLPPTQIERGEISDLEFHMGVARGTTFPAGADVLKMKITSGDHLFIDRVSYNFLPPGRGDIVVFQTKGIPEEMRNYFKIPPDQFYIKRLVGLGGETISLKQDYIITGVPSSPGMPPNDVPAGHLVVNGHELSASTPHFENLYSFSDPPRGSTSIPYKPNHYYGHAMIQELSGGKEFHVRPDYFFVMGDNTMNSLDSRYWGDFPQDKVLGKAFFVYWPINGRFGLSYH
jgi:signal peptidase I